MPCRCRAERVGNSDFVSQLRLLCVDMRVAVYEAQDAFSESTPTCGTVVAQGWCHRGGCRVRVFKLTSPNHEA